MNEEKSLVEQEREFMYKHPDSLEKSRTKEDFGEYNKDSQENNDDIYQKIKTKPTPSKNCCTKLTEASTSIASGVRSYLTMCFAKGMLKLIDTAEKLGNTKF